MKKKRIHCSDIHITPNRRTRVSFLVALLEQKRHMMWTLCGNPSICKTFAVFAILGLFFQVSEFVPQVTFTI